MGKIVEQACAGTDFELRNFVVGCVQCCTSALRLWSLCRSREQSHVITHPPPACSSVLAPPSQHLIMADISSPGASAIPQKRSFTPNEDSSIPRTKPPREKKDTWRKKEALQSGAGSVGTSGKQPEASTPKSGPGTRHGELPGLVRYRLPPPRFQDYYGHRAPPMVHAELEAPKDGAYYSVTDQ